MYNINEINDILNNDNAKIVTDIDKLQVPTEKIDDLELAERIAAKLFKVLNREKTGIGLSANQIGIPVSVCVLNVKEPIYLINPKIKESSGELYYIEGCLSFPDDVITTKRYSSITVECDNYDSDLFFDVSSIIENNNKILNNNSVLECVAVQHEIDHLNGLTMFDRKYKIETIKSDKKYNRNDKIQISNGTDVKTIKYKFYENYKDDGYEIVEVE